MQGIYNKRSNYEAHNILNHITKSMVELKILGLSCQEFKCKFFVFSSLWGDVSFFCFDIQMLSAEWISSGGFVGPQIVIKESSDG